MGGIVILGANGSGKSTVRRELARMLKYKYFDIEDYYFPEAEIPYSISLRREDVLPMILADIEKYGTFVISAVNCDFGININSTFRLAVYLYAPLELRIDRIKQRAIDKFGERVLVGGDMYEQENAFMKFAAERDAEAIYERSHVLLCPVISVDGSLDVSANAAYIAKRYAEL